MGYDTCLVMKIFNIGLPAECERKSGQKAQILKKSCDGYHLCTAIAPAPEVQLTWILFLGQVHTKHLVLGF